ncbi:carbohydrate esterase family 4 protein [Hypoxylon rubiginosum]|uniref:Carbohydrate esterase family 4 protein n=1 Tax=Hypoxylon rubiginosum TaxID=110542 RepID=A0ACC0D385_9PEZI|nr:carbohydrate esterase family 4 protein [Hypoxylon rubiginosum]
MARDHLGNVPYGGTGVFSCAHPGQVALTFDDGPWQYTSAIADALESYGFRATFFVTGNNLLLHRQVDDERTPWPALLRDLRRRGHQLGSHTWTHQHLDIVNHTERVREMVYNEMALRNALGDGVPTYMRLPYGGPRSQEVKDDLADLGYHVIQYNVDTKDYLHNSEEEIEESIAVFEEAIDPDGKGSYIVLCHDIREWTARRLVPAMLEILAGRGYEGVTVGECLDDPEEFWYRDPEKKKKVMSNGS